MDDSTHQGHKRFITKISQWNRWILWICFANQIIARIQRKSNCITYRASRRCSWRLLSQAFWVICHWTIFAWWGHWCCNIDRNKWWSQSLWSHLFRASQKTRHLLWDLIYQKIKSSLNKDDKDWWAYSFWHFCKQRRWIESADWG